MYGISLGVPEPDTETESFRINGTDRLRSCSTDMQEQDIFIAFARGGLRPVLRKEQNFP